MGVPVSVEIDPEQDSAIYIFDVFFECKVRSVDLLTEDELKNFGSFNTGMEMFNHDNMTQLVSANLSIAQIAEHLSKGFLLRYVHAQDVLKLYEFTQHHLNRWMSRLSGTSLNGSGMPVDDLIKLDLFCSSVYEQAKFYDMGKLTSLEQRYGVSFGFNAVREMFNSSNQAKVAKLQETVGKHRKGYIDLLNEIKMKKELAAPFNINSGSLNRG